MHNFIPLLLFFSFIANGQPGEILARNIPVSSYTTKNGLSDNSINQVIQDEQGFLWVATGSGLSRYDSETFKNYTTNKTNPYSLPGNHVDELLLFPNNKIWMSVNEFGITVLDRFSNQFKSYLNSSLSLFKLPNANLFAMSKDHSDNIWFALYGEGVYMWDVTAQVFVKHGPHFKNNWLSSVRVYDIFIDSKNRLWVCTIDSKVFMYDINTGANKEFTFSEQNEMPNPIYSFTESASGRLLAGGYSGVYYFDETTSRFYNLVPEESITNIYNGEHSSVMTLLSDSDENLWIGTNSSLLLFDNKDLYKINFFEEGKVLNINEPVISIFESTDGNIWIGTNDSGLMKVAPDWNRFNSFLPESDDNSSYIRRAYLINEQIWLVHYPFKIDIYSIKDHSLQKDQTLSPDFIGENLKVDDIYHGDSDDKDFLISTFHGLYRANTVNPLYKELFDFSGHSVQSARNFCDAGTGKIFFNLFREGLIGYIDKDKDVVRYVNNDASNHLLGSIVYQIQKGPDGNIWIATNKGLESLNPETLKFEVLFETDNKLAVTGFYPEVGNNNIWLIVNGSLRLFSLKANKLIDSLTDYSKILPEIKFYQIKKRIGDVLYISTENKGVVEINLKTGKQNVFTNENGLQSNYIVNILFPELFPVIVTANGIASYNSHFISPDIPAPKVIIDTIFAANKKILPDTENAVLNYNYGALDFDVALLSYTNSASVEYQYKLEGLNNNWVDSGKDNHFSFLNLKSGNYNFMVRGRGNYGKWSQPESFRFKVQPPPWVSPQAYLIYFVLGFLMISWLYFLYRKKQNYEKEILRQQTQKQIAKAASAAKSEFLARVSHEIRTPLNGVLGMSELMQTTELDEEQRIYSESVFSSGKHLLEMINDILDLSKIEAGKLELDPDEFNLLSLTDEVVSAFTSHTRQKRIVFNCVFESSLEIYRYGDSVRIKQILFNLLSNSFKFTNKGHITLTIKADTQSANSVSFLISDSGIGIKKHQLENLFQPFVQAETGITRKYGGTGLGLAIVKQLVEKMQGDIRLINNEHKGCEFLVNIPLPAINKTTEPTVASAVKVCLKVENNTLKKTLQNHLGRLNTTLCSEPDESCSLMIADVINDPSVSQKKSVNIATSRNVPLCFIGFDTNNIKYDVPDNDSVKFIQLPLTFMRIKSLCGHPGTKNFPASDSYVHTSYNILVIEDDIINQQLCLEMLEKMHHIVDVVDNAEEALILLERNNYDLLLTDYHLSGKDGLSLVSEWGNPENIPVILITADLTDDVILKCKKQGIEKIINKPFTKDELLEVISMQLTNKKI